MADEAGIDKITFKTKLKNDFQVKNKFTKDTSNVLAYTNEIVLYWSDVDKCIISSSLKRFENDGKSCFQTLVCSTSPAFEVSTLKCSPSGHHVVVYGENCVGVVELPRKWGEDGLFENGKEVIHCKLTLLDESFFMHHLSTKILQINWYEGSPNNQHIVMLTSDNCIRFYDISSPEQPFFRFSLFEQYFNETKNSTSIYNISSNVLGNTAVDFDIGKPAINKKGVEIYPIYVIQESGDVWLIKSRFSQGRILVSQQGPLTMNPPAQDNYGCDYCSLICLKANPQIIAMATKDGRIHHCIVMEEDAEDTYNETNKFQDASVLMETHEELYVYETVQLELTYLNETASYVEDNEETIDVSYLHLLRNPFKKDSYVCISNGGLHSIDIPWLHLLDQFIMTEETSSKGEIETPAEVSYLLCTQPSSNSPCISVCGCLLLQDESLDPSISCLLSSGDMLSINFNRQFQSALCDSEYTAKTSSNKFTSPLRQLKAVGGFHTYIAKILQKNATVPLIRSGGNHEMIPADTYYKLLTKTTQILREEYMQKMLQAKIELEKRCKILKLKKCEQRRDLDMLQANNDLLNKGEELASKLETAQENIANISDRISKVLRNMQTSSPVLSQEEQDWNKELKTMKQKLSAMKRSSEIVKTKHENMVLGTVSLNSNTKNKVSSNSRSSMTKTLSTTQSLKVRAVLKDQGEIINNLVEDVQALQLRVGR